MRNSTALNVLQLQCNERGPERGPGHQLPVTPQLPVNSDVWRAGMQTDTEGFSYDPCIFHVRLLIDEVNTSCPNGSWILVSRLAKSLTLTEKLYICSISPQTLTQKCIFILNQSFSNISKIVSEPTRRKLPVLGSYCGLENMAGRPPISGSPVHVDVSLCPWVGMTRSVKWVVGRLERRYTCTSPFTISKKEIRLSTFSEEISPRTCEFMVSINSFKSSSIQHDVYFVNECPIWSKMYHKRCSSKVNPVYDSHDPAKTTSTSYTVYRTNGSYLINLSSTSSWSNMILILIKSFNDFKKGCVAMVLARLNTWQV